MTTAICSYENIRQITSCTVCNRTFKDPRILPCGHTFCIDCIRNTMLDTTVMACPNCLFLLVLTIFNSFAFDFCLSRSS